MSETKKKLEIEELPARAKVLDKAEAEEVFGGAVKRGAKKRPAAKKKAQKGGKGRKVAKKGKKPGKKINKPKRPLLGGRKKPVKGKA